MYSILLSAHSLHDYFAIVSVADCEQSVQESSCLIGSVNCSQHCQQAELNGMQAHVLQAARC